METNKTSADRHASKRDILKPQREVGNVCRLAENGWVGQAGCAGFAGRREWVSGAIGTGDADRTGHGIRRSWQVFSYVASNSRGTAKSSLSQSGTVGNVSPTTSVYGHTAKRVSPFFPDMRHTVAYSSDGSGEYDGSSRSSSSRSSPSRLKCLSVTTSTIATDTLRRISSAHLATNAPRLSGRSLFDGLTSSTAATNRRPRRTS